METIEMLGGGPAYSAEEIEDFVDRMGIEIGHDETCSYGLKATTLEILEHFITRDPECEYFD